MLSPPRPVTATVAGAPARRDRLRLFVLVAGVIALAMAVLFPFAPVRQPDVTYAWRATDGAAAIALMPYQPVRLDAHAACVRDPGRHVLLSTVPPRPDPTAEPLYGLVVTTTDGLLDVQSAGVELFTGPLPDGDCTVAVTSDPGRTTVTVGSTVVVDRAGDLRPDVAGAFSDLPDGADLTVRADTRFETTISPLKAAVGIVGVLALAGLLMALALADRRAGPRVRLLPRGWWRPRLVDGAVVALLLVWWLVGSLTVDDGYISGIVRSTGENGFIGNVYRWLNAPESPFSWFYGLYYAWSLVSPAPLWMRLPATLLGLVCWWLLARLVLPRLGTFARRRSTPWLAALAFATWWVPLQLGLRPEPWVAVCGLLAFLAVERAVATRRVLPLAIGLVVAGVSTALTPAGLMAFTPFLAGGLPVVRLLRARRDLHVWPVVVALVAAPASAVYLMVTDQSLAGMLEATRVRTLIGGGAPWYQEYERYVALLEPSSFQGSIGRRAAVLVTLLAAVAVLWALPRLRTGIATGPTRRLTVGLLLSFAMFTASPTKWTQHFGDVTGSGAAVLTVALVAFASRAMSPRAVVTGLAAVTGVGALVLAGQNTWPYVSGWWAPILGAFPPRIAGRQLATVVLVLGGLLVVGLLIRFAWRTTGGAAVVLPRWVPGPMPVIVVLLAAVLLLQVGANLRTTVVHRASYTLGTDSIADLRGAPCGLERLLSVETDPAAGLLPAVPGPGDDIGGSVDIGGFTLPGVDVAGSSATPWSVLDPAQRTDELPVVLTTVGHMRPGDRLTAEFSSGDRVPVRIDVDAPHDVRLMAPAGADSVRLVVDASAPGATAPAQVTLPRVPRLTPMLDVLPAGSSAIVDWPVAFVFPCVTPAPLVLGSAGLPQWRITPPQGDPSPGITYAPGFGGPFAAARLLVTEQRMATYLRGDPMRDAASLVRWVPLVPMREVPPIVADQTVSGWHRDGHARVPGLDPVG